ncbi:OLC1v1000362C1 [Oldenlandia corymbosa var. corymbosa]|uniref:OLC1v1000362C1 n=1 Tax=Oldenlandia corymbosa var. corymbosa TaxID=529605 RepID=A0AAV1D460_OLDCO|nr:OLC1v1000362C1 [Oldenlandia corymbosa var. corymbosa]
MLASQLHHGTSTQVQQMEASHGQAGQRASAEDPRSTGNMSEHPSDHTRIWSELSGRTEGHTQVKGLGSDVEGMITRDTVGELLSDNPRLNECSIEGERLGPDLASPSKFTKHTVEDLLKDASKLKAKGSIEDKDALIERLLEYVKWQSSENKKLEEDLDHSLAKVLKFDEVLKTNQAAMEERLIIEGYTWWNGLKGSDEVLERLDRAFVNRGWKDRFPRAMLENLPIMRSDHGPILLEAIPRVRSRGRRRRFENFWTRYEAVKKIIRRSWRHNNMSPLDPYASLPGNFSGSLEIVMKHLSNWHAQSYGAIDARVRALIKKLESYQLEGKNDARLKEELDDLLEDQRQYW